MHIHVHKPQSVNGESAVVLKFHISGVEETSVAVLPTHLSGRSKQPAHLNFKYAPPQPKLNYIRVNGVNSEGKLSVFNVILFMSPSL